MEQRTSQEATNSPGVLTPTERETLRVALERGYFEVPRETTLVDIADEFGQSDVEVSAEIRSGISTVLRATDVLDSPVRSNGEGDSRSLDRMLDVLKHPSRRRILRIVRENDPRDEDEFHVEQLATEDDDLELPTAELYHVHLPRLAESDYIEWDRTGQTIRRGPNFEEIAPLLQLLHDH